MANWYGHQAVTRRKLLTPEDFLRAINKITAADIRRVAKNIFRNERLNLAVIGAVKEQKKLEKILRF
jgi:predicted Zn-dependent peptidase